jgi:hypothetical protein
MTSMAQKVIVTVLDDIDGSAGADTVEFMFDGTTYEIDLSESNQETLKAALLPFINAGRRTNQTRRGKLSSVPKPGKLNDNVDPKAVRAWAKSQPEYANMSERGRVASHVVEAFRAAQDKREEPVSAPEPTQESEPAPEVKDKAPKPAAKPRAPRKTAAAKPAAQVESKTA